MVLRERDPSAMPEDIAAVGAAVVKERDPYRVIGERLAELVTDRQFAELYATRGRAAVWPSVLALVTIFQFVEDLPDREAARAVAVRLDWKYALHLAVGYRGFDFSCLSSFRRRLLTHEQSRLVFAAVLEQVRALGEVDAAWVAQAVPTAYRTQYLERRSDHRLTAEERQAELVRVGQDGAWLLDRLAAETRTCCVPCPRSRRWSRSGSSGTSGSMGRCAGGRRRSTAPS